MKATTKLRLYEIKEKVLKPFSEVRRVISQFFETEYYYRWKKTVYPWWDDNGKYTPSSVRNLWYLNNTWDGCGPIFGLLETKMTHIYHNFRNYTILPDWYIDTKDVCQFGTEKEKTWAFNKLIKKELEDNLKKDKSYHFKGRKYYAKKATLEISDVKDLKSANGISTYQVSRYIYNGKDTSYDTYRLEKVIWVDTGKTKEITDTIEFCRTGKDVKKEVKVYESKTITLLNLGSTFNYKVAQYYLDDNSIDINIVDDKLLKGYMSDSVSLEPKDFLFISDTLKSHLHGRIVGLHKVYKIRKDINKLSGMDIMGDEPYKSEYEKICLLDSKVKRDDAWIELNEKFKEDQKKLSAEIMEGLLDCGEWTD